MAKYINKDRIVAEIERRVNLNETCQKVSVRKDFYGGAIDEAKEILSFLDTLEMKEVDLEKELKNLIGNVGQCDRKLAKHFFELGLKVNCPITANDRGMAEEIIINLKRVEKDYQISLTKEIEWLRNKTNKGE